VNQQDLIQFHQVEKRYGSLRAVRKADFSIRRGEAFGLVGESGSGKSTIGNMLIGLTPPSDGMITYMGKPLWKNRSFQNPRPGELQIVFQDPQSSLNPRMTVRDILLEPLYAFSAAERKEKGSPERLASLIKQVGLKEEHLSRYPHEFSGGQRQRIAIARALITDPSFLILDEPTSALDVSVQAQILNLLKELKKERKLTYLFISHNMSVIRYMCDRIAVMYKGDVVEIALAAVKLAHEASGAFEDETVGMEYSVILKEIRKAAEMLDAGSAREVAIQAERLTTVIRLINDEYFVALAMRPDGNYGKARFLLRTSASKLAADLTI